MRAEQTPAEDEPVAAFRSGLDRKRFNQTRINVEDFSFWPRNNFDLEPV
jgi:hypothetical protein